VRAAPFLADMADPAQVEDLVGRVTSELGPVGVSVSNHGVRPRQRIPDTTPAEWDAVIRSNLSASFHLARPSTKPPISQARRCMSAAIITCRSRDARPSVGGQQEISARERLENN
jgi:NAD(P)-dependent dehydrogenase (short-subunit alcohol dehydrogenase family)